MQFTYIHHIETGVPSTRYSQAEARDRVKEQIDDRRAKRIIHRLYNQSGIEQRFTAVDGFLSETPGQLFGVGADGKMVVPGTGQRNARFAEVSKSLSVEVARRALDQCEEFAPEDVTHVITVSCTGFYSPGPDYHIVRELGLSPTTERYQLGFMGCYAAFPALRMARQFCEADPSAVVLIVCIELCSLHLQLDPANLDGLLAGSLFADGAAAALVSARPPSGGRTAYQLQAFHSDLVISGENSMTWDIGDHGFDIVLSSYVPTILGSNVEALILPRLAQLGLDMDEVGAWAIHPGGRAILDKVRDALHLEETKLKASREVLRNYGNMSSPTILFVLKALLDDPDRADGELVAALAFGPGLTVEFGLLKRIPVALESPSASMSAWATTDTALTR